MLTDKRWQDYHAALESATEDNYKEHPVVKRCLNQEHYAYDAGLIYGAHGVLNGKAVIEIGAGYGGLCGVLMGSYKIESYLVVDHPAMIRLAKWHLKGVEGVEFQKVTPKMDFSNWGKYDLLISNFCLSETPRGFQDMVFSEIFPNCKDIFVIDGDPNSDYPERLKAAIGGTVKVRDYFNRPEINIFYTKE